MVAHFSVLSLSVLRNATCSLRSIPLYNYAKYFFIFLKTIAIWNVVYLLFTSATRAFTWPQWQRHKGDLISSETKRTKQGDVTTLIQFYNPISHPFSDVFFPSLQVTKLWCQISSRRVKPWSVANIAIWEIKCKAWWSSIRRCHLIRWDAAPSPW